MQFYNANHIFGVSTIKQIECWNRSEFCYILCLIFSVLTVWDRQRPISAIFGTKRKKGPVIHTLIFLKYKSNTRHRLLNIIFLKHWINCRNLYTLEISYFTAFFAIKKYTRKDIYFKHYSYVTFLTKGTLAEHHISLLFCKIFKFIKFDIERKL